VSGPSFGVGVLASRRWLRALQFGVWYVLFWTVLMLFFAGQLYALGNGRLQWSEALAWTWPRWYVWGLLTPGVFWVDRRLGAHASLATRVALHVPLAVAWTILSIVIRLVIRPLRGGAWPDDMSAFFLERFSWDILIYAAIAGVAIARDLARHARQREGETQLLALQATDLERRLVEARLQSLQAQLQPHFLFNALNTISAFTETDPHTARRLMGQLGDLLRASLTHASRPLVTLGEELTFLDDYLAIESARFEGRITVSVQADDDLLDARVPGFLLQPLVENAIRHGVAQRLSGGHIEVTATRNGSRLKLRVRDNGVGLPPDWRFDKDAGVGLRNAASRLEQLYGRPDLLQIAPLASGGVEIQLDLPLHPSLAASVPSEQTVRTGV
jgi:two-component system, LytTR family, sensor kinase